MDQLNNEEKVEGQLESTDQTKEESTNEQVKSDEHYAEDFLEAVDKEHKERAGFLETALKYLQKARNGVNKELPSRKELTEICGMLYNTCASISFPFSGILKNMYVLAAKLNALDASVFALSTKLQSVIDILNRKNLVDYNELSEYHNKELVPKTLDAIKKQMEENVKQTNQQTDEVKDK